MQVMENGWHLPMLVTSRMFAACALHGSAFHRKCHPSNAPCLLVLLQAKDLELSNPSKKAIAYTARLQGHSDFSIDASIVHIDAKVRALMV